MTDDSDGHNDRVGDSDTVAFCLEYETLQTARDVFLYTFVCN